MTMMQSSFLPRTLVFPIRRFVMNRHDVRAVAAISNFHARYRGQERDERCRIFRLKNSCNLLSLEFHAVNFDSLAIVAIEFFRYVAQGPMLENEFTLCPRDRGRHIDPMLRHARS